MKLSEDKFKSTMEEAELGILLMSDILGVSPDDLEKWTYEDVEIPVDKVKEISRLLECDIKEIAYTDTPQIDFASDRVHIPLFKQTVESKGMTYREISKGIGVDYRRLSEIGNGHSTTYQIAHKISDYVGVELKELTGNKSSTVEFAFDQKSLGQVEKHIENIKDLTRQMEEEKDKIWNLLG